MTRVLLFSLFLVQIRGLIISQNNVKLKPDKNNIVEYKINKKAFGFQKKATVNVTVTCVSLLFFVSFTVQFYIAAIIC